ncbi:uncharacterized protein PRCAT00003138001 [Priceomyces carsonii]|uniref:uncharacterized protein n=1 Tax=Priceomyces carsonii TaxID=28549 RepID=UPI002EDAC2BE|nr:unnamed protein product [Priceomyces carsonii]
MMRRAVTKIISNKSIRPSSNESNFKIDFNSVEDFYVQLDEPHNSWLPGDEVSGQIIFISKKNLANIVITLSLIGYVKINASSHSKLRTNKYSLFNHTIKIYGDDHPPVNLRRESNDFSNGLFKGEHRFPFIVKLPKKRVYTSIDFGRGSINYLLKAVIGDASEMQMPASPNVSSSSDSTNSPGGNFITRAKHLKIIQNSVYSSEKTIRLIDPIDVAELPPARPKKLIIKDPRKSKILSRTQSSASNNSGNTISTTSPIEVLGEHEDGEHDLNVNGVGNRTAVNPSVSMSSVVSYPGGEKPEFIKVALDIPQRGYLRGELIPVKLTINHLKKIQDLNGIILTFVRVCRLDNGPDATFESFRKDLQQLVIPLYVDPTSLRAEINTNIRVPADAFPTIVGCPLVSFQYFIEVLVNLSGKSVALDRVGHKDTGILSEEPVSLTIIDPSGLRNFKFNFNFSTSSSEQHERSDFIYTDKYKRMKKFLQLNTEVIIGTHRLKGGGPNRLPDANVASPISQRSSVSSNASPGTMSQNDSSPHGVTPHSIPTIPYINPIPESVRVTDFEIPPYVENGSNSVAVPRYDEVQNSVQPPEIPIPDPIHLSEKDRMKAHESSLLPSEPVFELIEEGPNDSTDQSEGFLSNLAEEPDYSDHPISRNESPFQYFVPPSGSSWDPTTNSYGDDGNELVSSNPTARTAPTYDLSQNDRLLVDVDNSTSRNSSAEGGH